MNEKTSSTSKEVPKIKLGLQDKYEKEKKAEPEPLNPDNIQKQKEQLPDPSGWRLLVLPFKMKERTKGGLYLGQETLERQQVGSNCGMVLKVGPHCYDKDRYPEGPWCKKGDWVIFARYAGSRIQIDGGEVRLLNDDEILATVENPEDIFHEF